MHVNACSSDAPVFDAWGSGKQSRAQRHIHGQAGEGSACAWRMFITCAHPHKPFRLSLGQLTKEKGGTDSLKEGLQ